MISDKCVFSYKKLLFFLFTGFCFTVFANDNYVLRFEFPFGIGDIKTTVTRGTHVRSLISIESFVHQKRRIIATLKFPPELKPLNLSQYYIPEENSLKLPFELQTQNDVWYHLIEFEIDSHANVGNYEIICSIDSFPEYSDVHKSFFVVDKEYANSQVKLKSITSPCDEEGNALANQQENTFIIKDPASRILRSFFISDSDHEGDHVSLQFENNGDYPVLLDVDYLICDLKNDSIVNWIDNLRQESGIDQKGINIQIFIEPHSLTTSVLKIRSRANMLISGEYKQKISVSMFTSKSSFLSFEQPLHIKKVNVTNITSTAFAFLIAILGVVAMLLFRKTLWGKLTSREYILIALYSSIAFSTVSIPSTILSNLLHAFLGPFSFLITGIFSEIISYFLLVSLVVLLPRPGVITSFLLVKFLLSAVVLGNLTFISFLWYPMRAVILEIAFYFSGLFEIDKAFDDSDTNKDTSFFTHPSTIIWAAFVIASADTLLSFVSLNMTMFFYRLFYADWYIWLNIAVSGFLYTFIAVPLGIKMGRGLKKVVVD
jgi:hypothetical protein